MALVTYLYIIWSKINPDIKSIIFQGFSKVAIEMFCRCLWNRQSCNLKNSTTILLYLIIPKPVHLYILRAHKSSPEPYDIMIITCLGLFIYMLHFIHRFLPLCNNLQHVGLYVFATKGHFLFSIWSQFSVLHKSIKFAGCKYPRRCEAVPAIGYRSWDLILPVWTALV